MSNDWYIPLSDLNFGLEEHVAVQRVLASKWLSMGPEVRAFEEEFSNFIGVRHAIAVSNATAGLHLAYLALGIGDMDEVVQPSLNFVAAANMTIAVGAKPVFADIVSLKEPTIDPAEVERLISPSTKAVVVMHYGGYLCQMDALIEICKRRRVALIEDACHAIGAAYYSQAQQAEVMAGSMGDVAAFSFFSNKNLATGEGGMLTTNRDDVADAVRKLRSHGMSTLTWDRHRGHANSYDVSVPGYNYRMDDLHAAIGREQLKKLDIANQRRAKLAARYFDLLNAMQGWIIPFSNYSRQSANHLMAVLAPDEDTRRRVVGALREARIQTSLHYPCITGFSSFSNEMTRSTPTSSDFAARVITLPLFPSLTEEAVAEICTVIRRVVIT